MPNENLGLPEWGDAEQIEHLFGITKGTLHKLAASGRIKSALIKIQPQARKGVRLFHVQSVRELVEASVVL